MENKSHQDQTTSPSNERSDHPTRHSDRSGGPISRTFLIFAGLVVATCLALIPLGHYVGGHPWDSSPMVSTYIISAALVALVLGVSIVLLFARTRYSVQRDIVEHRDVNEYVILWDRPRWLLYFPTMILSVVCGILTSVMPGGAHLEMLGGIWVIVAILNVLIEQFHMSVKTILIMIPSAGFLLLLLHLGGVFGDVVKLLRFFAMDVPAKLYFVVALAISLVIFVGWFHGLFNYAAITPNVADMQRGLTETGRQIRNDDYNIDFDASDIVERWLFGFGRIIISFPTSDRAPIVFFVPRAAEIDDRIRRVRSVTAIDQSTEA